MSSYVPRKINGSFTKEYVAYHSILRRTRPNNPTDIKKWGGTIYDGMEVDPSFFGKRGFDNFYAEVGPCPDPDFSIDRIENNKGYIKGNLRWASKRTSSLNRTSAVMLTVDGRIQNLSLWAEEVGLPPLTIWKRLKRGWSEKDAVTLPNSTRR